MTPRPFRVVSLSEDARELRYLSEWCATATEAALLQTQRRAEGWQRVDTVEPGQIPAASRTGRQVIAVGEVRRLPQRTTTPRRAM